MSARVILDGDMFPLDDERVAYLSVDQEERGVVLISLSPDWEPRFLLPLVGEVSGLPYRGFFSLGEGRFLSVDGERDHSQVVQGAVVESALAAAEISVFHGIGQGDPRWVERALSASPRSLVIPRDVSGAVAAGVAARRPLTGEWFVTGTPPPSPLSGELLALSTANLPPLVRPFPLVAGPGPNTPLLVQRAGSGPVEGAIQLVEVEGTRRVVVLARGLWRWGARAGSERNTYRRLVGALTGWLLREDAVVREQAQPLRRVLARGEAPTWVGAQRDTLLLDLRVSKGDSLVFQSTLQLAESGTSTPALPPGLYNYVISDPQGGVRGEGRFDVEAYVGELVPGVAQTAGWSAEPDAGSQLEGIGEPLRTHPAPYLLLLTLLAAEWISRRRLGLR